MKTMLSLLLSVLLIALSSAGQGRAAEWPDDLVAHMSGTWKLQGTVLGAAAHHIVIADWVLNHQFLRIHENTASSAPASESRYEAFWFISYHLVSESFSRQDSWRWLWEQKDKNWKWTTFADLKLTQALIFVVSVPLC